MRTFKVFIIIVIFIISSTTTMAGTTNTSTLATFVVGAMTFNVTGNLSTTIDASSGNLGSALNINYAMTTNSNTNNLQFKAVVIDSTGTKQSAIYSPTGNTNMYFVFGKTTPKSGTYDAVTALDEAGTYQVEMYIDNIP